MAKKIKDENLTELRKKFNEVTYNGFKEYARRNNISESRLGAVLGERVKLYTHEIMKVYYKLRNDGIYMDEFYPWEDNFKEIQKSQKSA